jgi:hypothetical protein
MSLSVATSPARINVQAFKPASEFSLQSGKWQHHLGLVLGNKKTGKTTTIKTILEDTAHQYDRIVIYTLTVADYKDLDPSVLNKTLISDKFDWNELSLLRQQQKQQQSYVPSLTEQVLPAAVVPKEGDSSVGTVSNRLMVVIEADGSTQWNNVFNSELFTDAITALNSLSTTVILSSQNKFHRQLILSSDYFLTHRQWNRPVVTCLYNEVFACCVDTQALFEQAMDKATRNWTALVVIFGGEKGGNLAYHQARARVEPPVVAAAAGGEVVNNNMTRAVERAAERYHNANTYLRPNGASYHFPPTNL